MFPEFTGFPPDVQFLIFVQAVLNDHHDRIVPISYDTKRVLLSRDLKNPSGVFKTCSIALKAATATYNRLVPLVQYKSFWPDTRASTWPFDWPRPSDGISEETRNRLIAENDERVVGYIRVSTVHDIFLVSPTQNAFDDLKYIFPRKLMTTQFPPAVLSQIQRVMEHEINKDNNEEHNQEPINVSHQFDREVFSGAQEGMHIVEPSNHGDHFFLTSLCWWKTSQKALHDCPDPVICKGLLDNKQAGEENEEGQGDWSRERKGRRVGGLEM